MAKKSSKKQARAQVRAQARAQKRALDQLIGLRQKLHNYVFQPTRWSVIKEFYAEQIGVLDNAIAVVRRDGAPNDFDEQFATYCAEMAEIEQELS